MKTKYLFISHKGLANGIATHLALQGNDVLYYYEDKDSFMENGIVKTIDTYKDKFGWADVIMYDYSKFGDEPLNVRKKYPKKVVIGGCDLTDKLEDNRDFGSRMFNLFGIKTPKHFKFKTKTEAITHIKKFPKKYVVKLSTAIKLGVLVAVEPTSQDLIAFLSATKYEGEVIIQEEIAGIEVAVTGFFNGEKFIEPIWINFEHKNMGNENVGLKTGEMGTFFFPYTKECKLYKETLGKIETLFKDKYFGFIDLNTITNTSGSYVLEITPRFGHPITPALSSTFGNDWEKFIELVKKGDARELFQKKFSMTVLLYLIHIDEKTNGYEDCPIIGLKDIETIEAFEPDEVKFRDGYFRLWKTYIGSVTASANYVNETIRETYRLIKKINVPQVAFYRTDIGAKSLEQYKWLKGQRIL